MIFKYSSLLGIIIAFIGGGYFEGLKLELLILIALFIYIIYNEFNSREIELKRNLIQIEEKIKEIK